MKALRSRIQAEVRRTGMPHTTDEPVALGVQTRPLLHGYGEVLDALLSCYRLEEVIAEKLRALLQVRKRREERGWSRSRVRDYYDIWRIIREPKNSLDCDCLPELLLGKCGHRDCRSHLSATSLQTHRYQMRGRIGLIGDRRAVDRRADRRGLLKGDARNGLASEVRLSQETRGGGRMAAPSYLAVMEYV